MLKKIYAVWISCACVRNKDGYTAVTVYINAEFAQVMAEGRTQGKNGTENGTENKCLTELGLVAIGKDGNGRMLTCIDLRPLPDEIAHTINRKYRLSARENRQIRQKTSGNVLQSGN
ncbi:MAG: hypothetical protein J6B53_16355 [Clostridia bacterium]|nr:hypothetical protein [Clostridia bacterium]